MIFKVVMMSGQEVMLENEEAVQALLREANEGKKLVLTKHGVINIASIDSIVPHKEKLDSMRDYLRLGKSKEEALREVLEPSPFAKLLGPKMSMLSPRSRTAAQEEASRQERGLKS